MMDAASGERQDHIAELLLRIDTVRCLSVCLSLSRVVCV
jgi:hypothetical protein